MAIMNNIGKKIKDKLAELHGFDDFTIAFLPYKRSMWNSMASVYEECDKAGAVAYILPLPYYLMPEKKVVRDDFENALPIDLLGKITFDFLVIHYPYDHNNKVTGMLPEYHTAELKKYGKVIYIPYSCTNMRQLRVQPGIANVDYAFLGSEGEAEAFINEWAEMGVDFKGRVFGYGSPKMDVKIGEGKENVTLVINSLGPYLASPLRHIAMYKFHIEQELDQGRRVIFRPHPLLNQTIKAMRPDTAEIYNRFIMWVKENAKVDESEDLESALNEADYLISDPSSVLEMWQATGKPYKVI